MATDTLARRLERLAASGRFPAPLLEAFGRWLAEAPERELFRASPLTWAQARGEDETRAISLFLHATHVGLLEFTWGVLCPGCGAFLTTPAALRSLAEFHTCQLCEVPVAPEDETVEVAFTVTPAVRPIRFHRPEQLDVREDGLALTLSPNVEAPPQVEALFRGMLLEQRRVGPGESTRFTAEVGQERWSLTVMGHHAWAHLHSEEGSAPSAEVDLVEGRLVADTSRWQPGTRSLTFHNRTPGPVTVVLLGASCKLKGVGAAMRWRGSYLTARRLVTSETFGELFRAQSIPAEGGLAFKSLTLLFTDLKGSTELYERIGDLRAYQLVSEHFALLRDIIAANGGAMVKTIGDAVMAAFAEPAAALAAAVAMRARVGEVGEGGPLQLKVGLHAGPCIAVELNERLDYFGQTVNLAARVQGAAAADAIACTPAVLEAPGAREVLEASGLGVRAEQALLKGVEGPVALWHLAARPASQAA